MTTSARTNPNFISTLTVTASNQDRLTDGTDTFTVLLSTALTLLVVAIEQLEGLTLR